MRFTGWRAVIGIVVAIAACHGSDGFCGYIWDVQRETRGIPGREDGIQQVRNFLDDGWFRSEHDGIVTIMDFSKRIVYHLDPVNQVYRQLDMQTMDPSDMGGARGNPAFRRLARMVAGEVRIEMTDEVQTIQGYRCRKAVMHSGMVADGEYWISKDVPYFSEIISICKRMAAVFEENPNLKANNFFAMMIQMDGFPVKTETHAMGGRTVGILQRIVQQGLKKELFSVPTGYRLVDSLP